MCLNNCFDVEPFQEHKIQRFRFDLAEDESSKVGHRMVLEKVYSEHISDELQAVRYVIYCHHLHDYFFFCISVARQFRFSGEIGNISGSSV